MITKEINCHLSDMGGCGRARRALIFVYFKLLHDLGYNMC